MFIVVSPEVCVPHAFFLAFTPLRWIVIGGWRLYFIKFLCVVYFILFYIIQ